MISFFAHKEQFLQAWHKKRFANMKQRWYISSKHNFNPLASLGNNMEVFAATLQIRKNANIKRVEERNRKGGKRGREGDRQKRIDGETEKM